MENAGEKHTDSGVFTVANSEYDVITTSTDSENFGTWTVVKNKHQESDATNRVEELEHVGHHEDETENDGHFTLKSSLDDSSLDDVSDGISIISETESSGRLSPHPSLRQHLNDFKKELLMDAETESPVLATAAVLPSTTNQANDDFQIKHRRRKYSHTNTLQPVEIADAAPFNPLMLSFQSSSIVRKGLSALFYVGVFCGILGIVGRLHSPEWGPTSNSQLLEQLQVKFNDMELQNNLMRAEINILTKQVNYLTNLRDQHRKGDSKGNHKPPAIHEADQTRHKEKTYKKLKAKLSTEDNKDKEETVNTFETIENNIKLKKPKNPHENIEKIYIKESIQVPSNGEQNFKPQENQFQQHETFRKGENMRDRMEERVNKDYSNHYINKPYKQELPHSKEFLRKHEHETMNKNKKDRRQFSHERLHLDDDDGDFSGERFQKKHFGKKSVENDSRERFYKNKQDHKDGERSMKGKDSSREKKDGRWHEEYMKHRENERHSSEKKRNDKNWFIERGDSREQIRHR